MILEYDGRKKPEYKGCIIKRWNPNYKISNITSFLLVLVYNNGFSLINIVNNRLI